MSELRTIKKYPNRRLYDTVESRYITLADIRKLVIERVDFLVIDKKTDADITRSILLQVICEQEDGAAPLLSRDFLANVIRCYGGAQGSLVGSYLEQSLKLFSNQQRSPRPAGDGEVEWVVTLAQRNWARWRSVQDEIYRTLTNAGRAREARLEDEQNGVNL